VGAVVGAILAATGLVEDSLSPLDEAVVASIDGENIYLNQYRSYVEALQQDRGYELSTAEREHILSRLIDEKLLIRHGEQSGLTRTEPTVRKAIVDAVIENIVSDRKGLVPDQSQLERFYADNRAYFSHAPLLQVQRMVFRGPQAAERAGRARLALTDSQPFAEVKEALADREVLSLPGSPMPATRLPNYLGPSQARAVAALEPGQVTAPLTSGDAIVLLGLVNKLDGETPPLSEVHEQVLREYQRRENDQALRDYLDELRADSDIRLNKAQLQAPGKTGLL
jgi:hypothetical protein